MRNENAKPSTIPPVIAFTIEELTVGGAERMLVCMANEFVALGWDVHVILLRAKGELAAELDKQVTMHVLHKKLGIDFSLPMKLHQCIKKIQPLCVNSHLCVANTWTRVTLFFSSIPVVATEHSRDEWKPGYYRFIDRLLSLRTASLVAVSADTASFYREEVGIDDSLIRVINNGIETEVYAKGDGAHLRHEWLGEDTDTSTVLLGTVGRVVPAKNHRRLIDVLQRLLADKALAAMKFKLVIVGEGSELPAIQQYVEGLGLTDAVIFTGTRHDIPDVLDAFDLFVLSSDREGHPLTALEAQAAGTPVVLTNAGGAAEAIAKMGNQNGGMLVERTSEALTDAIKLLLLDREGTAARAKFAREYALANFDLRHMVERYANLFKATKKN